MTYSIKEVIKGKIFWRLNKKVPAYEAATSWNRGIPCNFFKTLIQLYLFYLFLYFWLTASKRVSKAICLEIIFKSVGLWGSYGWNRGIPCKILKFLITLYLVLLNGSERLSEVIYLEIKWICRPIRQINPETRESLVFSSKF